MNDLLKVRMLLRVSSKQQLDSDGDLPAQRKIVEGYIHSKQDWELDSVKPEYHEYGVSGYRNSVEEREVLQEILKDAKKREFNILVCYKDDRLGRREDEIPTYIKELASNGVLVYTVKEDCITPKTHEDALFNFIRFWSAQGDSMKTGERVRDTAKEQVRMGKNQGGNAPFGYCLEFSGEFSKHQRALKKKVIVPEEAELVKKIFNYALTYGYGAFKIAKILNANPEYAKMARNGVWKAGTLSDMLKNPIYTGYETYCRRTHDGNSYRRLSREEWVISEKCNEEIKIIDKDIWEKVQQMREDRKQVHSAKKEGSRTPISTTGRLCLIDVAHCGCCGRKLTNGSKYNQWTTKDGDKRKSVVGYYRCQARQQGENCEGKTTFRADNIEPEVFDFIESYLRQIEDNKVFIEKYKKTQENLYDEDKKKLKALKKKLSKSEENQRDYEVRFPEAMRGELPISFEAYCELMEKEKETHSMLVEEMRLLEEKMSEKKDDVDDLNRLIEDIPAWSEVFREAEPAVKRMIVNKLIERIDVKADEIKISVKLNLDDFLSRKTIGDGTIPYKLDSK